MMIFTYTRMDREIFFEEKARLFGGWWGSFLPPPPPSSLHTAARLIAKQDYTHADQALTDSFYEGFYSDE